jgi:hypothetical protein
MSRNSKGAGPEALAPSFIRLSKQWYWEANRAAGASDEIMVGLYHAEGGCSWEFAITEHAIERGAVRVEIFEDALKALRLPRVVEALHALEGCRSLDEAEIRLAANGIQPRPPERKPKAVDAVQRRTVSRKTKD